MSSILKALKKLEQEKALHAESAGINLSREILRQNSGSRNMGRWLWLLGSAATVVIIILSAALLRTSTPKETVQAGSATPAARQPALPAVPVEKPPVSPQETGSGKGINPPPPSAAHEPDLKPARQNRAQPAEPPLQNETAPPPAITAPVAAPPKTVPGLKALPARQPAGSEQTLTLSGIAWNKDSADRLAIINGQPIATGSNINGIVVEEILQDRVKLSHNGKIFELLIGRDAKLD